MWTASGVTVTRIDPSRSAPILVAVQPPYNFKLHPLGSFVGIRRYQFILTPWMGGSVRSTGLGSRESEDPGFQSALRVPVGEQCEPPAPGPRVPRPPCAFYRPTTLRSLAHESAVTNCDSLP